MRFIPSIETTSCTTDRLRFAAILAATSLDCGVAAAMMIPDGAAASIADAQDAAS